MFEPVKCKILRFSPDEYYHRDVTKRDPDPTGKLMIGYVVFLDGKTGKPKTYCFPYYLNDWHYGSYYIEAEDVEVIGIIDQLR